MEGLSQPCDQGQEVAAFVFVPWRQQPFDVAGLISLTSRRNDHAECLA